MTKAATIIGPDCSVEHDRYGTRIGTDNRMNGLDQFATIHTTQEATRLMAVLQRLYPDAEPPKVKAKP